MASKAEAPNRRSVRASAPARSTEPHRLDDIDRRILGALRADGRLTIAALAERVGLSQSPCWTRLRRLEEAGLIRDYVAVLDHRALGIPDVVFVEVTLDKHDDSVLEAFGSEILRIPEVLEAHLVTGEYDYMIKVAVSGTAHYERFLREKLYRLRGIRQSRSVFALRTLKQEVSVDPVAIARQAP
ncbi:Lrp/AsnC family transcriptional regulator [Methylobacterium nonmethylotrophicum]|uniref:Lrp/AsnC family transcriptional regulator n=1 Tax=Methylobacterium nonmethylotrophicum TaxID=1141884 RepID=A0A4Z0NQQ5_9HYPH|nr:Lrp/AsnC family transcriptional regulator [Methylobacterium nonmethylotrophicum]TGD98772.1 Lrp/AsnC family transcriptional regulator [Methylobacterium nonmethylotrophicum]